MHLTEASYTFTRSETHIKSFFLEGGGFLGVAGGNLGRPEALLQHRQPLADPPSPDSTDPKISAFYNVTLL